MKKEITLAAQSRIIKGIPTGTLAYEKAIFTLDDGEVKTDRYFTYPPEGAEGSRLWRWVDDMTAETL